MTEDNKKKAVESRDHRWLPVAQMDRKTSTLTRKLGYKRKSIEEQKIKICGEL